MKLRFACVSLVTLLGGAAPAAAGGVVTTPPVFVSAAGTLVCLVQNLTGEYAGVTGRVRDSDALVVSENIDTPIPPGIGSAASNGSTIGALYCEFEGLKNGLRGFLSLNDGGHTVVLLPASR
jgi:hypothetical protein